MHPHARTHLDEVGVLAVAADDELVDLGLHAEFLHLVGRRHVPLGQPRLALPVLEQQEADLWVGRVRWVGWVGSGQVGGEAAQIRGSDRSTPERPRPRPRSMIHGVAIRSRPSCSQHPHARTMV